MPCSQPTCVPVSARSWRSMSASVRRGSTASSCSRAVHPEPDRGRHGSFTCCRPPGRCGIAATTSAGSTGMWSKLAPAVGERVVDRVQHGCRSADRAALAHSLGAGRAAPMGVSRWMDLKFGQVRRGRQKVIHRSCRRRAGQIRRRGLLEERGAYPLGDAAAHLAVDNHRVDHDAAVLDHHVADAGARHRYRVDIDDRAVVALEKVPGGSKAPSPPGPGPTRRGPDASGGGRSGRAR